MAHVRQKVVRKGGREYRYYQLVEGYRDPEAGVVCQRVLKHLGRFDSIEEAHGCGPGF